MKINQQIQFAQLTNDSKGLLRLISLVIMFLLPHVLLILLSIKDYYIIKTLLTEKNIFYWKIFVVIDFIIFVINVMNFIYLKNNNKKISIKMLIFNIMANIIFLTSFFIFFEIIFSISIPNWMLSYNISWLYYTLLLPSILYSLVLIVIYKTKQINNQKAWHNFAISLIFPISVYLFSQILIPISGFLGTNKHFFVVILIVVIVFLLVLILFFFYFILKGIYILLNKKSKIKINDIIWKTILFLILPYLSFYILNKYSDINIDMWFYILLIFSSIFLIAPNFNSKKYRLLLFVTRSLSLSYSFYFFLVFVPLIPVSFILIFYYGSGFLMIPPVVIFLIHLKYLQNDFLYLKNYFSSGRLIMINIIGFALIPTIITISFFYQKKVINNALEYVYSPDFSKTTKIDTNTLEIILQKIKRNRKNKNIIRSTDLPIITSFYNLVVFDNRSIPKKEISKLERIFLQKYNLEINETTTDNPLVKITSVQTDSYYSNKKNAWVSNINLEITNTSNKNLQEFKTDFKLALGCWVSDYYLYVNGKKEYGLLSEKKSALWIYSQILRKNKDPGILYYKNNNTLSLRVFPFKANETRKTGFQLIHQSPVKLKIDNESFVLGNNNISVDELATEQMLYLSAEKKQKLEKHNRKPYLHFIIDISETSPKNDNRIINTINQITSLAKAPKLPSKISMVNTYIKDVDYDENFEQILAKQEHKGSFFLDRAIQKILVNSYLSHSDTYPVIIVISQSYYDAIINPDYSQYSFCYPESDAFYVTDLKNGIFKHSFNSTISYTGTNTDEIFKQHTVFQYIKKDKIYYLSTNYKDEIILLDDNFDYRLTELKQTDWLSALQLFGISRMQLLHPENKDELWLQQVIGSFKTHILSPYTSFIVLENKEQKERLIRKQKEILKEKKYFFKEVKKMSEPNTLILSILFFVYWYYKRKSFQL